MSSSLKDGDAEKALVLDFSGVVLAYFLAVAEVKGARRMMDEFSSGLSLGWLCSSAGGVSYYSFSQTSHESYSQREREKSDREKAPPWTNVPEYVPCYITNWPPQPNSGVMIQRPNFALVWSGLIWCCGLLLRLWLSINSISLSHYYHQKWDK